MGWEGPGGAEVLGWMETVRQAPPQAETHRGSWPLPSPPCCARGTAGCELLARELAGGVFCFLPFPSLFILMSGHGKPVGHRGAFHPIVCLQHAHAPSRSVSRPAQRCSRGLLQGHRHLLAGEYQGTTPEEYSSKLNQIRAVCFQEVRVLTTLAGCERCSIGMCCKQSK